MKCRERNFVWLWLSCLLILLVLNRTMVNGQDVLISADKTSEHPLLFFKISDVPALRLKSQSGWLNEIRSAMIDQAEIALRKPYLYYKGEGSEIGIQQQILSSAMTGYITGEKKYIDNAVRILCSQVNNSEVDVNFPKILNIGITAHTYSVGYDWLAPFMNEDQRKTVKAEIEKFGDCIYKRSQTEFWGQNEPNRLAHNWNGICHGGLGLSALVLQDHSDWLNLAVSKAEGYLRNAFDDTGVPWEGLGYCGYGMRNFTPMVAAYEKISGRNLFDASSRVKQLPLYLIYTMYPWGKGYVPICQTGDPYFEQSGMFYVINRYHNGEALWIWLKMMELDRPKEKRTQYGLLNSLHPYIILWADSSLKLISPQQAGLPLNKKFAIGTVCMKDGWDTNNTLVTFTAGSGIHSIWNHADICSFTLIAEQERFAVDLGHNKWTSAEHNIVLVDNAGYYPDGGSNSVKGSLLSFKEDGDTVIVCGDSQKSYPPPFLKSKRTLLYKKSNHPYLLIVDDMQKNQSTHEYTWQMYTMAANNVKVNKNGFVITGSVGGKKCFGRFLWPADVNLQYSAENAKISGSVNDINPHFVTLLAWKEDEMPKVAIQGNPAEGMEIKLLFTDGDQASFLVQGETIKY